MSHAPSQMRFAPALLALAFALVAGLSGCGQDNASTASVDRTDACTANADCPSGTCQAGVCVTDVTPLQIDLRVDPPDFRADLVRESLPGLQVTPGQDLGELQLGPPVRLQGIVRWDDDDPALGPLAADVIFRSADANRATAVSANVRVNATNGRFDIDLPPGRYDIIVLPERTNVPRRVFSDFVLRREDADASCAPGRLCVFAAFVVPAPARYERLQGELLQQTPQLLPVPNARVWATTVDGRLTSTSTLTDSDGRFTVFAPPADQEWRFTVAPSDTSGPLPVATFEAFGSTGTEVTDDIQLWAGNWNARVPVRGQVVDSEGRPVSEVTITGRSVLDAGSLEQVALEVTEGYDDVRVEAVDVRDTGEFEVWLLPGVYRFEAACSDAACVTDGPTEFVVAPPENAPPVSADGPVQPPDSAEPPSPLRIVVFGPVPVRGVVDTDAAGGALLGTVVDAEYTRPSEDSLARLALDASALTRSALTDEDGAFSLELLPGPWRFRVTPSDTSGPLPFIEDLRRIGLGGAIENFPMRARGALTGRVIDESGAPLRGAWVEAWTGEGEERRTLGRTRTGEDGRWRVVLP